MECGCAESIFKAGSLSWVTRSCSFRLENTWKTRMEEKESRVWSLEEKRCGSKTYNIYICKHCMESEVCSLELVFHLDKKSRA